MTRTLRKTIALLLVSAQCVSLVPAFAADTTQPHIKTEDFSGGLESFAGDWTSNRDNAMRISVKEEDNALQVDGGGSGSLYHKLYTSDSFVGDISLSFDVWFESDAKTELLYFTPRYNTPKAEDTSHFEEPNYYSYIVLNTAASSGLRLARNNKTVNDNVDSSISTGEWQKTGIWYSVKYELTGNTHSVKLWPKSQAEPETWNLVDTLPDTPVSGSVAFAKQGTRGVYLDNISICYLYGSEDPIAYSIEQTLPIEVSGGTPFEELGLPETLLVTFTDGAERPVSISWDGTDYQADVNGKYMVSGMLNLTDEQNPKGLIAEAEVSVIPAAASCATYPVWMPGEVEGIVALHQFGVIETNEGTLLALAEGRIVGRDADEPHHILLKRSGDGGQTWGSTIIVADYNENKCSEDENLKDEKSGHCYANPTPVVDQETGRVFVFYAENFGNDATKIFYKCSDDDAVTWSAAIEVTELFDDDVYGRVVHLPGPGHGLQLQSGEHSGRLMVETWHRQGLDLEDRQYGLSVLFSDDNGETWENSEYLLVGFGMNEGRIAQFEDGTLVINSRARDSTRKYSSSTDGGKTWSVPKTWTSIGSYDDCDSGFVSSVGESLTRLLTAHPATGVRNDLSVYLSYDGGRTWPYSREVWNDPTVTKGSGASDLCAMENGRYGVLHGTHLTDSTVEFVVFNLEWLVGQDDETEVSHEHYGGTATCIAKAVCMVCGVPYGEIGPHSLCSDCGRCSVCAQMNGGACTGHGSGSHAADTSAVALAGMPKNGTVTLSSAKASRGAKVTLTAVPDEGYTVGTVTVLDSDGKRQEVTDNGDGTFSFLMPVGKASVKVDFAKELSKIQFLDVTEGSWYHDAVLYVGQYGLIQGDDNGCFLPSTLAVRSMVLDMLYALEERPQASGRTFADVPIGAWYADAMIWAADCGIVDSGVGMLEPNGCVTREQLAVILYRYANYKEYASEADGDLGAFVDVDNISPWATEAMSWAVAQGILSGRGNGISAPDATATRAEVATMLQRFLQRL